MADETIITPESQPELNRVEERITQLSDKVKTEADARSKAEATAAEAERRATFAEGFVDVISTNPAAKDHKDEIREKVLKGYTMEDATFAVLGKAGKLGNAPEPVKPQVAGGSSAVTNVTANPDKDIKDMTLAEKREMLDKALLRS